MPKLKPETQQLRREHILDAARSCFARTGFHRTTMQDICRAAEVSPGALYVYFDSKEALIEGLCERDRAEFAERFVMVREAPDFLAGLQTLAEHYFVEESRERSLFVVEMSTEATRNPRIAEIVSRVDRYCCDQFAQLFRRLEAEGRIAPTVGIETAVQAFNVVGDGLFYRRAMQPDFDVNAVMPALLHAAEGSASSCRRSTDRFRFLRLARPVQRGRLMSYFSTKKIQYIAAAAVAGLGGYLLLTGKLPFGKKAPQPETAQIDGQRGADLLAAAVSVSKAAPMSFIEQAMVTGTLVARDEILVGPEIEGLRIVEVLADEGMRVKKGDILARLVTDTLDAQIAQNDAALAKASAAIAQARSNIAAAEAKQVETKNTLDRGRPLRQSGVISEATQDQRESAAKTAQAQLVSSQDALKLAEAEKRQVEALRRDLDWRRSRTDVRAPADGVVSRRIARVGGYAAGAADAMFRIIARGEVELDAEVSETVIARMKEGQRATVEVAGLGPVPGNGAAGFAGGRPCDAAR